jgi:dTDP-4-dehydrorhamnose reductase
MRVLVTGGSGLVGWTFLGRADPGMTLDYTYYGNHADHPAADGRQMDVRDADAVSRVVTTVDPDVIVHSAAMTDVDACETDPETAWTVNVEGTENVVRGAAAVGARVVSLSTSFVFDGSQRPHTESSPRAPINEYGRTKAEAERIVEETESPSTIVRTDQPYGWSESWQGETMVEWTLDELATEGPVEVFDDWHNVPTYLPCLADVLLKIVRGDRTGVYHAVGSSFVSRCEWAKTIADAFGHDSSRITSTSSDTVGLPAKRPNVDLSNRSVTDGLGISMVDVSDGARRMLGRSDGTSDTD